MSEFDRSRTWSHLKIVDNQWLRDHSLSLYEFLGATDADGLFKEIDQVLTGKDPEADKRKRMTALFHKHVDGQSTERLLKRVL
jgi:hypothetical protein